MTEEKFASLHNHSFFSFLDAVPSPEFVVQQAYDLGFSSVALSDHGNMHSFIRGYKKAKELGINYVCAIEAYETDDMYYKEKDAKRYHLILLAKNNVGLKNLFKIVTESHINGFYVKPRCDLNLLKQYSEGIVCFSSCLAGRINRIMGITAVTKDNLNLAKEWVQKYKGIFGDDFYLELQSHDTLEQRQANRNIALLARETNTKCVITFDTHLKDGSDIQRNVHALFIQTQQNRDESDFTKIQHNYMGCFQQSIEEIHQTMDAQVGRDLVSDAIKNTYEVGESCKIDIPLHQSLMPHIEIPDGFKDDREYLKELINQGWKKRGFGKFDKEKQEIYKERLRQEFEVIDYLDYCSYFIMLQQLYKEFRKRKIPLNNGRGSAGGCLILYTLEVTEVDSIRWDLDFSRFANKGRVGSPADVDMDISKSRRKEALEVAAQLFGQDYICQLATFNSMSPKVCIRDLGKALNEQGVYDIPYTIRDIISKMIPDGQPNDPMTIEKAMDIVPDLRKYEKQYPLLFEYTRHLQNVPKSVGSHASAVIVAPRPIIDFAPVMYNKDGNITLQLEMEDAMDEIGLVKLDFLGLGNLDIIDNCLKFSKLTWKDIDLTKLNLDDKNVLDKIYNKGNTVGIFQMESVVPQKMFSDMTSNIVIDDIFAISALNRPGLLKVGMDKVYIHNKNHPEDIKYIHPDLEQIFNKTYGVCLYQEQALSVFKLAGFPDDKRDVARRAIGHKDKDRMISLYEEFKDGLSKRGWTEEQIQKMWDLIEVQSSYSFNASHSVSYGLLSYVTAYLKYHYPIEFMTALLISEIGDYQQTTKYIDECNRMNIEVLPPDINKSDKEYSIRGKSILFGLLSIKGVGESAVEEVLRERYNGNFTSLEDFYNRINTSVVNVSTIVSLIKAGCFSFQDEDKIKLLNKFAKLTTELKPYKPVKTVTKQKLYEADLIHSDEEFKNKDRCLQLWNDYREQEYNQKQQEKLNRHIFDFQEKYMLDSEMFEFETLSIFLSNNPFTVVKDYFKPFDSVDDNEKMIIGGVITNVKYKKQKRGGRFAYVDVLTQYGLVECMIFAQSLSLYQDLIKKSSTIVALAKKSGSQFVLDKVKSLSKWKEEKGL